MNPTFEVGADNAVCFVLQAGEGRVPEDGRVHVVVLTDDLGVGTERMQLGCRGGGTVAEAPVVILPHRLHGVRGVRVLSGRNGLV